MTEEELENRPLPKPPQTTPEKSNESRLQASRDYYEKQRTGEGGTYKSLPERRFEKFSKSTIRVNLSPTQLAIALVLIEKKAGVGKTFGKSYASCIQWILNSILENAVKDGTVPEIDDQIANDFLYERKKKMQAGGLNLELDSMVEQQQGTIHQKEDRLKQIEEAQSKVMDSDDAIPGFEPEEISGE